MGSKKQYWKGLEEVENPEGSLQSSKDEFPEELPVQDFLADDKVKGAVTNRRDFLKFLGFSLSAAALASCETPVNRVVPYVNKPEEVTPGIPTWYASTYFDGIDFGSILVKTREGRPIHIIGNKHFGMNGGAVNPRINASTLSLYDSERLQNPTEMGKPSTWSSVDKKIQGKLQKIASNGGNIRLLTNTLMSPSTEAVIRKFREKYGASMGSGNMAAASDGSSENDTTATDNESMAMGGEGGSFEHVIYDTLSASGILKAHKKTFGKEAIPYFDLSKAKTIVGIGADFLGNWIMPTVFADQYSKRRNPEDGEMSKHYQYEANLTITGSSADVRYPIKPSQEAAVVASIHDRIASKAGKPSSGVNTKEVDPSTKKVAEDLWANRGMSVVVSGNNDPNVQVLVNSINHMLGNYGNTVDLDNHLNVRQGDDEKVQGLLEELQNGEVDALLIHGVNPAYSLPEGEEFKKALKNTDLTVSFSRYADETADLCDFVCPDHHFLESWNDLKPREGNYALVQPTIRNLFSTRQFQDSLLKWAGEKVSYADLIEKKWKNDYFGKQDQYSSFKKFWGNSLHNGVMTLKTQKPKSPEFKGDVASAGRSLSGSKGENGGFEMVLYPSVAIGDGSHANNPWLQELPDPLSKVTWDNYIAMSPEDMKGKYSTEIGQEAPANMAKVTVNGKSVELPVFPQPGQKKGTISIALGYGRGGNNERVGNAAFQTGEFGDFKTDKDGNRIPVGENVFPFVSRSNGTYDFTATNVKVEKVPGKTYPMAATQTHHTIMGRDSILRETTLETYKNKSKSAYNPAHTLGVHEDGKTVDKPVEKIDLWESHPVEGTGHRWGLSIDLTTCIGCSACVIACHSENNVPVVGKDEVRRVREMHWLRIDRYFSSVVADEVEENYDSLSHEEMDTPEAENPDVTFQPMMCQHCNHAPCETVCPVAATTHSEEGMNMMAYNRCIGTRYCANNCPYKVRRFNWFNYKRYKKFKEVNPAQDNISRMVLNPDVTVRSRGVMEKCSLCVQRIQNGKLEAKKEGRPVEDGEIQTACAEACPTNAITFGDINDKNSQVRKEHDGERGYYALEEIGTQPNIAYQVKVRNRKAEEDSSGGGHH